jgi:hypothetical protein
MTVKTAGLIVVIVVALVIATGWKRIASSSHRTAPDASTKSNSRGAKEQERLSDRLWRCVSR